MSNEIENTMVTGHGHYTEKRISPKLISYCEYCDEGIYDNSSYLSRKSTGFNTYYCNKGCLLMDMKLHDEITYID